MTEVAIISADLLSLAGFDDPTKAPAAVVNRVLSAINQVGQRLYLASPKSFFATDDGSTNLHEPTQITGLSLTHDSKTIAAGTGLLSWMHGCSVQIAGEQHVNELRQVGSASWELKIPYTGTTNTGLTGTVYGDAYNLERNVIEVQRPSITQRWELKCAPDIYTLRRMNNLRAHWNDTRILSYPFLWLYMQINVPTAYMVEPSHLYTGETRARIRVYPMPDTSYPLIWKQREAFEPVTSLTDTRLSICPHQFRDSIFLPLARKAMAAYPGFLGNINLILADAEDAEQTLRQVGEKQHRDVFMEVGVDSGF